MKKKGEQDNTKKNNVFLENPIINLTRIMWRFSKGNHRNVILYIILFIIANSITFFEPLIVAYLLNTIQTYGVTVEILPKIIFICSLFIITRLLFWAFHGPARWLEQKNAFYVRANYKKYLLDKSMDLSLSWHTEHHSGDTIDKVEKGCQAMFNFSCITYEIIDTVIRFVSSYIALIYFNFSSIYIVLFMMIITFTIIIKMDKTLIKQYKELNKAENKISAKVFDTLSNITTIIILRIEKLASKEIFKTIMNPFGLFSKNVAKSETKWFFVSTCSTTMMFLVMVSYFLFGVKTGTVILVGTVYILYGYVQRISDIFFRFTYRYGDIVRYNANVSNTLEIVNEKSVKDIKKSIRNVDLSKKWNNISVKNLTFSYHTKEGADLHLENISMSIKNGEKIAFVGHSGSGKTTMLKVIRDLYTPKQAKVFIEYDNKMPIQMPKGFSQISKQITLIPQDPEIFATTIRENITMGIQRDDNYIKRFTDLAVFSDVVKRLPKGLDSSINEKGVNLSGGEKQRLALSRGLMACEENEIILLDEPTSSVDFRNEYKIYKNIFGTYKDKTIISSIHRLHLLNLFDKIYFFDKGKIVAFGTLDDVLKSSKEFKNLWKKYHKSKENRIN